MAESGGNYFIVRVLILLALKISVIDPVDTIQSLVLINE